MTPSAKICWSVSLLQFLMTGFYETEAAKMSDYSTYILLKDSTSSYLEVTDDRLEHGTWENGPYSVSAQSQTEQMRCADVFGVAGTRGVLDYRCPPGSSQDEIGASRNALINLDMAFACPFGSTNNEFSAHTNPSSIYKTSFVARTGDSGWQNNSVPPSGHPLHVEVTVSARQRGSSDFVLTEITSASDHNITLDGYVSTDTSPQTTKTVWPNTAQGSRYSDKPSMLNATRRGSGVSLHITASNDFSPPIVCQFVGYQSGSQIAASNVLSISAGNNDVPVTFTSSSSDNFNVVSGDVEWKVSIVGSDQTINQGIFVQTTRLELYWVYSNFPTFFNLGVSSFVLRYVTSKVVALGHDHNFYVDVVVAHVFSEMHKVYRSDSHYTDGLKREMRFYAYNYISDAESNQKGFVNCFDQTAAIQVMLGAIGISTTFLTFEYYFYMPGSHYPNGVPMVGGSTTNNPTWEVRQASAIEPPGSKFREPLSQHAFLNIEGYILDGCFGPVYRQDEIRESVYLGTYLVDKRQESYQSDVKNPPYTEGNWAKMLSGVTQVISTPSIQKDYQAMSTAL